MKHFEIKKLTESEAAESIAILAVSIALIYSLISVYFCNHFFFHTEINGVNVSLKAYDTANQTISDFIKGYELQLTERDRETEEIAGQDIDLQYNEKKRISEICQKQISLEWIGSLFKGQKFYINNLFIYNQDLLKNKISQLDCLNKTITKPKNVNFEYSNGSYKVIREVYGNEIIKDKLDEAIKTSIENGETKLNLEEKQCYENPTYTSSSDKTLMTKRLLDRYVSSNITYKFGDKNETLDGNTINKWLHVGEKLDVKIDRAGIVKYVNELSRKYDTVGTPRDFAASVGKTIAVKGGLYGWKIDQSAEAEALFENITRGETVKREPIYAQTALSRGKNEIGSTYLEIDITKQHVWFYREGKLIAEGPVVTGNPNRGWSTVTGTYSLNYKQKGATLSGPGSKTNVTYWMPFFGNIGLHDAYWRSSFGGQIYKRNGTHGCINAPFYLAKTIFDHIEAGTPVVCYEEG
ncbi:hypothetical protein EQM14_12705 [Caproiciproducens sp. NJN-50]|uniref:L,D-transpeptidase family protein n=1 Tax=Acutalibacteraceae TaxID=3082771 RepID=UPI000FFE14E7|nr:MULTISPECIES: L,D-transpeptidase family protein [Acutalibacteraceae]QAT50556.1 hypothetical protein EQM14_12705 [Caproiciproducens sp. NJN-50]